jgi:hypothetical protein
LLNLDCNKKDLRLSFLFGFPVWELFSMNIVVSGCDADHVEVKKLSKNPFSPRSNVRLNEFNAKPTRLLNDFGGPS